MLIKYFDKDDIELNTLMKYRYTTREDLLIKKLKLIHSIESINIITQLTSSKYSSSSYGDKK